MTSASKQRVRVLTACNRGLGLARWSLKASLRWPSSGGLKNHSGNKPERNGRKTQAERSVSAKAWAGQGPVSHSAERSSVLLSMKDEEGVSGRCRWRVKWGADRTAPLV